MSFISFLHRGVPADIQIDIDEDRETERIYSLFTLSLLKLQKMEGKYIRPTVKYLVFTTSSSAITSLPSLVMEICSIVFLSLRVRKF